MVKKYRSETQQWRASAGEKPFGHARCRSGLELITAVFPDNQSQLPVAHLENAGQLRVKVLNPTMRDQPNVSVRSTLQEHHVKWRDHSDNGRTMLRTPVRVPGTARSAEFLMERSVVAGFDVSSSGMETILTELQLDGRVDTIHEAQSEIHVDVVTAPSASVRSGTAPLLFICYAHADRAWKEQFVTMFQPAVHNGKVAIRSDQDIPPGADWHAYIGEALEACDAALLLVTPKFHASDYITKEELQTLLKRGTRIFWVSVTSSLTEETNLAAIQCVNDPKCPISSHDTKDHPGLIAAACRKVIGNLR